MQVKGCVPWRPTLTGGTSCSWVWLPRPPGAGVLENLLVWQRDPLQNFLEEFSSGGGDMGWLSAKPASRATTSVVLLHTLSPFGRTTKAWTRDFFGGCEGSTLGCSIGDGELGAWILPRDLFLYLSRVQRTSSRAGFRMKV